MYHFLKAIIYFIGAIILLRLGGKKSISQSTPAEVAIMIGIGTVLVHPLKSEDPLMAFYGGALIVSGLIITSFIEIYLPKIKNWIIGQPVELIKDGEILEKNLIKSMMTVDELKMKLRIKKINNILKIKSAVLEANGDLSIEANPQQSYATKEDIEEIKKAIKQIATKLNTSVNFSTSINDHKLNLFNQVEEVQEQDPLQ
ncbi:uncharacterized protein DUF421 [Orenia metallireducens]|uniref:YetF C-terminal domain-containing protein n=1 Tax=Orenia metallireducens TaxID=1413210 RepID=A0A285HK41_9FIRM|nr:YetF domain-containing protein [Orenia metallireducens]PRX27165.1 uncharacterized protein DUF421 [Orenia metallireducens]SNY35061.1 Protein of unknown function [Orenia metallireducens]